MHPTSLLTSKAHPTISLVRLHVPSTVMEFVLVHALHDSPLVHVRYFASYVTHAFSWRLKPALQMRHPPSVAKTLRSPASLSLLWHGFLSGTSPSQRHTTCRMSR